MDKIKSALDDLNFLKLALNLPNPKHTVGKLKKNED